MELIVKRHSAFDLTLSSILVVVCPHIAFGQNTCPLAGTVTVNFDSVAVAPDSFIDATSYLNSYGITFTPLTPSTPPIIWNGVPSGPGLSAAIPSSPPNVFFTAAPIGAAAVSYRLDFCASLSSVSFTRTGIIGVSGDAPWTGAALNAQGQVLDSVSEGFLIGSAAARYTLTGTGITSLQIDARNDLTRTTFNSPPLDD